MYVYCICKYGYGYGYADEMCKMCVDVDEATQNGIEIDNEINGHKTPWHIPHIKFTLYEFYACALFSRMQHIPHHIQCTRTFM